MTRWYVFVEGSLLRETGALVSRAKLVVSACAALMVCGSVAGCGAKSDASAQTRAPGEAQGGAAGVAGKAKSAEQAQESGAATPSAATKPRSGMQKPPAPEQKSDAAAAKPGARPESVRDGHQHSVKSPEASAKVPSAAEVLAGMKKTVNASQSVKVSVRKQTSEGTGTAELLLAGRGQDMHLLASSMGSLGEAKRVGGKNYVMLDRRGLEAVKHFVGEDLATKDLAALEGKWLDLNQGHTQNAVETILHVIVQKYLAEFNPLGTGELDASITDWAVKPAGNQRLRLESPSSPGWHVIVEGAPSFRPVSYGVDGSQMAGMKGQTAVTFSRWDAVDPIKPPNSEQIMSVNEALSIAGRIGQKDSPAA